MPRNLLGYSSWPRLFNLCRKGRPNVHFLYIFVYAFLSFSFHSYSFLFFSFLFFFIISKWTGPLLTGFTYLFIARTTVLLSIYSCYFFLILFLLSLFFSFFSFLLSLFLLLSSLLVTSLFYLSFSFYLLSFRCGALYVRVCMPRSTILYFSESECARLTYLIFNNKL